MFTTPLMPWTAGLLAAVFASSTPAFANTQLFDPPDGPQLGVFEELEAPPLDALNVVQPPTTTPTLPVDLILEEFLHRILDVLPDHPVDPGDVTAPVAAILRDSTVLGEFLDAINLADIEVYVGSNDYVAGRGYVYDCQPVSLYTSQVLPTKLDTDGNGQEDLAVAVDYGIGTGIAPKLSVTQVQGGSGMEHSPHLWFHIRVNEADDAWISVGLSFNHTPLKWEATLREPNINGSVSQGGADPLEDLDVFGDAGETVSEGLARPTVDASIAHQFAGTELTHAAIYVRMHRNYGFAMVPQTGANQLGTRCEHAHTNDALLDAHIEMTGIPGQLDLKMYSSESLTENAQDHTREEGDQALIQLQASELQTDKGFAMVRLATRTGEIRNGQEVNEVLRAEVDELFFGDMELALRATNVSDSRDGAHVRTQTSLAMTLSDELRGLGVTSWETLGPKLRGPASGRQTSLSVGRFPESVRLQASAAGQSLHADATLSGDIEDMDLVLHSSFANQTIDYSARGRYLAPAQVLDSFSDAIAIHVGRVEGGSGRANGDLELTFENQPRQIAPEQALQEGARGALWESPQITVFGELHAAKLLSPVPRKIATNIGGFATQAMRDQAHATYDALFAQGLGLLTYHADSKNNAPLMALSTARFRELTIAATAEDSPVAATLVDVDMGQAQAMNFDVRIQDDDYSQNYPKVEIDLVVRDLPSHIAFESFEDWRRNPDDPAELRRFRNIAEFALGDGFQTVSGHVRSPADAFETHRWMLIPNPPPQPVRDDLCTNWTFGSWCPAYYDALNQWYVDAYKRTTIRWDQPVSRLDLNALRQLDGRSGAIEGWLCTPGESYGEACFHKQWGSAQAYKSTMRQGCADGDCSPDPNFTPRPPEIGVGVDISAPLAVYATLSKQGDGVDDFGRKHVQARHAPVELGLSRVQAVKAYLGINHEGTGYTHVTTRSDFLPTFAPATEQHGKIDPKNQKIWVELDGFAAENTHTFFEQLGYSKFGKNPYRWSRRQGGNNRCNGSSIHFAKEIGLLITQAEFKDESRFPICGY